MPTGAGATTGGATAEKQDVCRVSVKLPPFWPEEPALWFAQVEGQFTIAGITADSTKFYTVVGQLDHRYMVEARDIIENPPAQDKYAMLKAELVRRLSDSREKRVQQILTHEELGDRKPSQFLRHLQTLAGSNVPDAFLSTLWASRLPTNIQTVIASQPNLALQSVADLADRVHEIAPAPAPALTSPPAVASTSTCSEISELKQCIAELTKQVAALQTRGSVHHRSRSSDRFRRGGRDTTPGRRSRSNSRGPWNEEYCWYHNSFGDRARRCNSPCTFAGNATGSRK